MYLLDVCKWVGFRLLGRPIAWFWLLGCLALWPAMVVFSPVAVTLGPEDASRLASEVAFLASLGGVTLALSCLGESEWMLRRVAPARRYAAQALGMLTGGAVGIAASLLIPLALGRPLEFAWGEILTASILTTGHLVGGGLLLLRIPMGQVQRSLLLPLAAWVLPSLVDPQVAIGRWAATLLRADRDLELFRDPSLGELGASLAPIVLLWLCAALLEGRPAPDPIPRT